ncbi:MAG: hypothetical protein NZM43_03220 [Saprospiraceae bacterium]|nr:hypothetical protein [Saprospiraceae bacterium]MDW8483314.1 hypothetical protein [Saprospiraceae bacterium]
MNSTEKDLFDELAQLNASLPKLEHRHSLKVPEGYFNQLEERLFQRLKEEGIQPLMPEKRRGAIRRLLWPVGIAAALILAIIWWIRSNQSPTASKVDKAELTANDIEMYLQENPHLVEPREIAINLPPDSWTDQTFEHQGFETTWEIFLRDLSPEELNNLNL